MSYKVIEIKQYKFPVELYYNDRHLWLKREVDGALTLGMDDLGQKLAGKIVAMRLVREGYSVTPGKIFGTMESAKWVERLKSPVTGIIKAVNQRVRVRPQIMNEEPYGAGWLVKIAPTGDVDGELAKLAHGEGFEEWAEREIEEKEKQAGK